MKTLKELSLLLLIIGVCALLLLCLKYVMPAEAVPLDTYHSSWHLIRDTAAEDGATFAAGLDLAGAEGDFGNKPSGAFHIRVDSSGGGYEGYSPGGAWMFAFAGTDTINDTFSYTMVTWAKTNGMAQVAGHGDGILGSQDVVLYPHDGSTATNGFWADTVNMDALTSWPEIGTYNSGNNEVGLLVADMTGVEWVQFFIYDAGGAASECTDITVYGRRY